MVAMAFLCVGGIQDADAVVDGQLEEGDIRKVGGQSYYVVLASKQYDDSDFQGYDRLYIITGGSTEIVADAFNGCTSIEAVMIANTVKSIGPRAFMGTTNMTYLYSTSIEKIGESAFEGSGIRNLDTFGAVVTIGENAFKDCKDLTQFDLHDSKVTSIPNGAFMNSGMEAIDLRNITYVHPDAFIDSDLRYQVVTTDQGPMVLGTACIYYDGTDELGHLYGENGVIRIVTDGVYYFDVRDADGNPVETSIAPMAGNIRYQTSFTPDGRDVYIGDTRAVIDFPEGMGEDVVLDIGKNEYDLPMDVVLGDLEFKGWEIEGLEGIHTKVDKDMLIEMHGHIVLKPVFGNAVLTMDHSEISGYTDTSDLEESTYFTYGSTYPVPKGEVDGYVFDGWMVGEQRYAAGDPITTYTNHTAKSLWKPAYLLKVTYSDGRDGEVGHTEHPLGTTAAVDAGMAAPEEDHQRFLGWSLDGESVLEGGYQITMKEDVTLQPVFGEREPFDVTFMVDDMIVSTHVCYDGRSHTVSETEPVSDTAIFVGWKDAGGAVHRTGDSFTVTSDMTLTAEWRNRVSFPVTYIVPGSDKVVEFKTEGFPYTVSHAAEDTEDSVFMHWTDQDGNTVRVGDVLTEDRSYTLTAVMEERGNCDIVFRDGETELGRIQALEGWPTAIDVEDPVKDGMVFVSWTDPEGNAYVRGSEITVTQETVLTAQWRSPGDFTVTFTDGAGNVLWTFAGKEGSQFTIDVDDPVMKGKVFLDWTVGEAVYSKGDTLTLDGDVELTAQWRDAAVYRLTFDHGGEPAVVEVFEGEDYVVDVADPVSASKVFLNWTDGENDYSRGDTISPVSDMTLTAEWRDRATYKVVFYSQGKEVDSRNVIEGGSTPVHTDKLTTPSGKQLAGWSTAEDGTAEYRDGASVTPTGDMELHAVWKDIPVSPPTGGDDGDDGSDRPSRPSNPSGSGGHGSGTGGSTTGGSGTGSGGSGSGGSGGSGTGGSGGSSTGGSDDDKDDTGTAEPDDGSGEGPGGDSQDGDSQGTPGDGTDGDTQGGDDDAIGPDGDAPGDVTEDGQDGGSGSGDGSGGGVSVNDTAVIAAVGVVALVTVILAVVLRRS